MSKLLIVDDEVNIRAVVREYAEFEEYQVDEAENGMEAVEKCKQNDYDLIIMDVMMPKLDGYSASKEIKKHKNIPIIMLSARGEEYDKLFGFEIGVDDYVVKPFSPKELMARVKAVLMRSRASAPAPAEPQEEKRETLVFEGLEIDMAGREVYVDGKKASMTPKEYDLLFYLVRNKGLALTRDKLLESVWGYDFFGDDRTVDTHIKMLRNSLGEYRKFIVTLRGMGYKFDANAE
ncbi:MAG: response regulator transcription factor [Oscillospiraceae bacterium]|nr:response regulator transcription factor [Oscillospiraceae bacterium]